MGVFVLETTRSIRPDAGLLDGNRRDHERFDLFLPTAIITGRQEILKADLVNISQSGFLVRVQHQFQKRERLRIALPHIGDLPAEVAWSLAGSAGCSFIFEMTSHDFSALIQAIRGAGNNWLDQNALR